MRVVNGESEAEKRFDTTDAGYTDTHIQIPTSFGLNSTGAVSPSEHCVAASDVLSTHSNRTASSTEGGASKRRHTLTAREKRHRRRAREGEQRVRKGMQNMLCVTDICGLYCGKRG